jgi:hypothetical protein
LPTVRVRNSCLPIISRFDWSKPTQGPSRPHISVLCKRLKLNHLRESFR